MHPESCNLFCLNGTQLFLVQLFLVFCPLGTIPDITSASSNSCCLIVSARGAPYASENFAVEVKVWSAHLISVQSRLPYSTSLDFWGVRRSPLRIPMAANSPLSKIFEEEWEECRTCRICSFQMFFFYEESLLYSWTVTYTQFNSLPDIPIPTASISWFPAKK